MKLSHLTVVFIIVILPFSIVARNTMNEYFLTLKDQVRLNNVIDTATQDALETLVELNDEFQMLYFNQRFDITQTLAKEAIKTFFQTMAVNFNLPYIEGKTESYFSMYVPAIVVIGYDGFFVYTIDDTGSGFAYQLSPKIPYAYEDEDTGALINFTLGNDIKLYTNNKLYEGELTDNYYAESKEKHKVYLDNFGGNYDLTLQYVPDITNDMSVIIAALKEAGKDVPDFLIADSDEDVPLLQDYSTAKEYDDTDEILREPSEFHKKRREVIINLITETLEQEIHSHSTFASMMGSTYSFSLPEIPNDEWINSINDISVMSFIQGLPIGANAYYNNYALGASRIVETDYIYGTSDKYYHSKQCDYIATFFGEANPGGVTQKTVDNVFVNRVQAAQNGYYPCTLCNP